MPENTGVHQEDAQVDLLKKLLMLELFKLGVPQSAIGKKLKIKTEAVNGFLKGLKRGNLDDGKT
jgi:hypothetical protein